MVPDRGSGGGATHSPFPLSLVLSPALWICADSEIERQRHRISSRRVVQHSEVDPVTSRSKASEEACSELGPVGRAASCPGLRVSYMLVIARDVSVHSVSSMP